MAQGYTLIELLVAVTLLGVISAIGIPLYMGYADTATANTVQNNLRAMYLQQQEYLVNNNVYYKTGDACDDSYAAINTNLFGGKQVLAADGFGYCVTQATTADFTAMAVEQGGPRIYTIDQNNVSNF